MWSPACWWKVWYLPGRDLQLLTDAALAAGDIARRYWRKSPEVWDKGGGAGPVSAADLAVNAMLEAELRAARPDYGWLSEETPDSPERLETARQFIVDPIDGTRAFLSGETSFAHAFAVAEGGRITAAVVYLPMKDALYAAVAGGATRLNGVTIRASSADIVGASMLTAKGNLAAEHWQGGQVPPVEPAFRASLAYRMALVAEGRFDAMMTLKPCWEWDSAAGTLILERAGAIVTDRRGAALSFNAPDPRSDGVLAAGSVLHAQLLARLSRPR